MFTVRLASVPADLDDVRALFREYADEIRVDLHFQGFEGERAGLPGAYGPPGGRLILALAGDRAAGCVALRSLGEGTCEMKRMYVRPEFRGRGLGRSLAERILAEAQALGYARMRLDSIETMSAAVALYRSLGFVETAAYYHNPLAGAIYLERALTAETDPAKPESQWEPRR